MLRGAGLLKPGSLTYLKEKGGSLEVCEEEEEEKEEASVSQRQEVVQHSVSLL